MSAFILRSEVISDIAESIAYSLNFGDTGVNTFLNSRGLAETLDDCKTPFPYREYDAAMIYEELFKLNAAAVAQRYKEEPELLPERPEGRRLQDNLYQYVKYLDSFIYQCSEGSIPDTQLYKALVNYDNSIYRAIVRQSPEYEAAQWA